MCLSYLFCYRFLYRLIRKVIFEKIVSLIRIKSFCLYDPFVPQTIRQDLLNIENKLDLEH